MAVGLLLWVFWIALHLNCSTGFPSPRAQFQPALDGQQQLDDQYINALATGERDGDVVDNKPSVPFLARYQWPTVAKPPSLVPSVQNMPDTIDQPEPQTLPVNVDSASVAYPIAWEYSGQSNEAASPTVQVSPPQKPSSPKLVGQPSYKNWMSIPFSQTQPVNVESASVAYPSAWEYSGQSNEVASPTVQVSPPQKPSSQKVVGQPSYKDWMSMPFTDIFDKNLMFGQFGFQPENSVQYEKHYVPVSFPRCPPQPVPPPPSRQNLIRKSKNGYRRERLQESNHIYWADPKMQQMTGSRKVNPLPNKLPNRPASRKM